MELVEFYQDDILRRRDDAYIRNGHATANGAAQKQVAQLEYTSDKGQYAQVAHRGARRRHAVLVEEQATRRVLAEQLERALRVAHGRYVYIFSLVLITFFFPYNNDATAEEILYLNHLALSYFPYTRAQTTHARTF